MADSITPQHPLVRDGRSQTERLALRSLAPELVKLDDRSERQLLVYLNEFAKAVAFYDTEGKDGNFVLSNWQPFFQTSSSVQVSLIGTFDASKYENGYAQVKQSFAEGLNRANYSYWFDFLFDSALTINSWLTALSADTVLLESRVFLNETPLRRSIADLIKSNLQPALAQLFSIVNLPEIKYEVPQLTELAGWDLDSIRYIRDNTLSSGTEVENAQRIEGKLDDIFSTFSRTFRQIVMEASGQEILQPTQTHEPHLALLYTFLKLLRPVINDFNGLTGKHLDFYYGDVLKLQPKPLVPDAVHVLFELPKPVRQFHIPKSTPLKDSKDANKVEVHFNLDEEIIVSHTQVAGLRTLFRDEQRFLARPKADSADGAGKDFPDPANVKWATLGEPAGQIQEGEPNALAATVGLVISSKGLILSRGVRKVTITLTCLGTLPEEAVDAFSIRLSGEKKWFSPDTPAIAAINGTALVITFTLGIKDDAIAPADPAALGVDYGLDNEAVLQLILLDKPGLYEVMRSVRISAVNIQAEVSQLQDVLVRTDDGEQDATKPFMPFGAVPSVGSAFAIGSPEIFSKNLTSFKVNFEWDKLPSIDPGDDKALTIFFANYYKGYELANPPSLPPSDPPPGKPSYFDRDVYFYKNGGVRKAAADESVFKPLTLQSADLNELGAYNNELDAVAAVKDPNWQSGAIVVKLKQDFLHRFYPEALVRKALSLANKPAQADPVPPVTINPPYTPVIKNLTISYTAEISGLNVFHMLPFDDGANYRPVDLNTATADNDLPTVVDDFKDEGALLIGLTNTIEGSLTPVLFQLLESSAKTNIDPAAIEWMYLDGNDWKTLEAGKNLVDDATHGLIRSGIVQIVLPERRVQKTTILPSQFYWLKVSAEKNTRAVCKAIGIHTQASRATFSPVADDDPAKRNDPNRLAVPLPAGSVNKLNTTDVNVKSVKQPYPSFGGRPAETGTHFYRRVSEQLRHKGRGVTLFDYEQLILEAFPEVFKAKCIPHTFANRKLDAGQDINDIHAAPGYVTVVVVPDTNRMQVDDLQQPMASRSLLTNIREWMKDRISPFARLQVLNPIYKQVDTEFKVQFYPGKSREYYEEQLKTDIGRFLAPWAFDPSEQITFGGVIYRSSILGFIENRSYVDFVTDFVMKLDNVPQNEVHAPAERVVFTNGTHIVGEFEAKPPPVPANRGIGSQRWRISAASPNKS